MGPVTWLQGNKSIHICLKNKHNAPMSARSMFAIYLYEDDNGNVSVRSDSYGLGEKVMDMGLQMLDSIIKQDVNSGGEIMFMLPIDRCELVQ